MSRQMTLHRALLESLPWNDDDMTHPTEERLLEFQSGGLDGVQAERIRSHLASCSDCADFVLAVGAFSAPEDALPEVDASQMASDRQLLLQRLRDEETHPLRDDESTDTKLADTEAPKSRKTRSGQTRSGQTRSGQTRSGPEWRGLASPVWGYGLAAALLVVVVGMLATQERQPTGLDGTRLADFEAWQAAEGTITSGFSLHSLEPEGSLRSGAADEVPEVRGGDILMLFGPEADEMTTFALEISAEAGHFTQRLTEFSISDGGGLLVRVPRVGLEEGEYELRLSKGQELMAAYKIRVLAAAS